MTTCKQLIDNEERLFNSLLHMSKPLPADQINVRLATLEGWCHEDERLKKAYTFATFRDAMVFLVSLSYEAEQRDHHPEIFNCYNRIEIALNTHDAGGKVTEKDFALATAIDSLG